MLFKKLVFLSVLLMSFSSLAQIANDSLNEIDVRYYRPQDFSLRDLSFQVRRPDLTKKIIEDFKLETVKDIYLQVYWALPNNFRIEVEGMPKGFYQIKQSIKSSLRPYLENVIPVKLSDKYKEYQIKKRSKQNGSVYNLKAPQLDQYSEINLHIDKNSIMQSIEVVSVAGRTTSEIVNKRYPWSHNKNLLQSIKFTSKGRVETSVSQEITYLEKNGFGFPEKIKVINYSKFPTEDGKFNEVTNSEVLVFSNYIVNSEIAKKNIENN